MTLSPVAAPAALPDGYLHKMEPPFYPIVYVRGYAMSSGERDETFHDAYYGFAATSVRKRQGLPELGSYMLPDVFEGQFVRFMKDFGYADAINRGNRVESPRRYRAQIDNPAKSLWISRFYDTDVLNGTLRSIKEHAQDLLALVTDVIPKQLKDAGVYLGENDEDYRVILLAHSMGGLVCRTVIQNLLPGNTTLKQEDRNAERWIHRLVTMATPHRGIDLGALPNGLEQWVVNNLNPDDANIFQEKQMRQYLNLPDEDEPVHSLGGHFPVNKCLCLIGSDYRDYAVGGNLVRRATGAFSDGLVKQSNAYVVQGKPIAGTPDKFLPENTAFYANVHKAHSGYEGIVNSYESWENVHRFLFGDVQAQFALAGLQIASARAQKDEEIFYDFEYNFTIRGTNTKLHWRAQEPCENAVRRRAEEVVGDEKEVPLHTAFLNSKLRTAESLEDDPYLYCLLAFKVAEHRVQGAGLAGKLWHLIGVDSDYEGRTIYSETVELRVGYTPNTDGTFLVGYRWASDARMEWKLITSSDADARDGRVNYRFGLRSGNTEGADSLTGEFVIHVKPWR